ncbi:uncharacterized protein STEHIDRAFT_158237 [Stereum hirsutum FP-91666 SS1]|uniref:uncharacterized protein n=1 Tax=Stereum hirsutum (strain FP-91666) TaxID=721885 RepID=UPI000444A44F|nr:uncharacterized protein STEHIDRAFT_158237 [Stereum hirsutum FP-91666 SS1]EIM85609.1 hypothetical protein STEHIDRAFT_158237 [Stereum hirsutum FP-91666 SS1]
MAAPLSRASYAASSASSSSGSSDSLASDFRDSEPDHEILISPSSSPPSDLVETFENQFIDGKHGLHTSRHFHSANSAVVKLEDCCGRLCSVCGEQSDQPRDKSRDVEICGECWDDVDV